MDTLIKAAPEIIHQAATSPLGIVALAMLSLSTLGYLFFRSSAQGVRLFVFITILAGFGLFCVAVLMISLFPEPVPPGPIVIHPPGGDVAPTPAAVPQTPLASGAPRLACGCNGPVMPGTVWADPSCQSGIAVAVPCPGWCFGGTQAWARVCR